MSNLNHLKPHLPHNSINRTELNEQKTEEHYKGSQHSPYPCTPQPIKHSICRRKYHIQKMPNGKLVESRTNIEVPTTPEGEIDVFLFDCKIQEFLKKKN